MDIGGKAEELPDFFSTGLLKGLVGAAALIGGKAAPLLSFFFVWGAKLNGVGAFVANGGNGDAVDVFDAESLEDVLSFVDSVAGANGVGAFSASGGNAAELGFLVSPPPEVPAGEPNEKPPLPIPVDAFVATPNEKPEAFAGDSFVFESSFRVSPEPPNENPPPLLLVLPPPADDAPNAPPNEKPLDPIDPDALLLPGFDAGNDEVEVPPPNVNPPLPIEPCAG